MRRSPSRLALIVTAACGAPQQPAPVRVCPADRAVGLAGQDDVAQLAGCPSVAGLSIRSGAPLDLTPLSELATITGDLEVGPTIALEDLALPNLRSVGGAIEVASNSSLRGVMLPRLAEAGRVAIEHNIALAAISLPRLITVADSFVVTGNGDLELIDVSALASVGKELVIAENTRLSLVESAKLARAGAVRIDQNPALPAEEVDRLRAVAPAR